MKVKNANEFIQEAWQGLHDIPSLLETIQREYSPETRPVFVEELLEHIQTIYCDLLKEIPEEDILKVIKMFERSFGYLPVLWLDTELFLLFRRFIRRVGGYTVVSNVRMHHEYVYPVRIMPIYLDIIVKAVWSPYFLPHEKLLIQENYLGFDNLIALEDALIKMYPGSVKQKIKENFYQYSIPVTSSFDIVGVESRKYEIQISKKGSAAEHNVKMARMMGNNNLKIGDEQLIIPEPVNKVEAFERLEKLHGQRVFEVLVDAFEKKYEANDPVPLSNELRKINDFISKAEELDIDKAFAEKDNLQKKGEYLRLKHGYYKKDRVEFIKGDSELVFFGKHAPVVYGKYFLFKNWLAERYNSLHKEEGNQDKNSSQRKFSVLEWATIFYYANETKLLPEDRALIGRMDQFIKQQKIGTTIDSFKKNYYKARKRINETSDYPINKLEYIKPFLKKNYSQTIVKVKNDIEFLKNEKTDY